ncbi:VOC family protein [Bifidobacterium crudilactis]|jgi:catechol 2,3-dioxygenase-like lactoylglutathione lyase family enzyme|uniref:VOC family protein n=1 Tax=Bifidobacterium crudilactis TaxID=327277 RepID=UPI0023554246|nr:VOC family protein [Bifidobacterium crudilactis]MCI1217459.1 VOC family protein [Bifidobacterium crudilactis]
MIDHITLHVDDAGRSIDFYTRVLAPLGYVRKVQHGETVGFGMEDGTPHADFYVSPRISNAHESVETWRQEPTSPVTHIAFRAGDETAVDRFHEEGLAAGGTENGEPGMRDYHPGYYSAFILDPDGNNIEAVVDWSHSLG